MPASPVAATAASAASLAEPRSAAGGASTASRSGISSLSPHPSELNEAVDGRRARGERNRASLLDAVLDLLRETGTLPGAAEVAERAQVSVRSVFRHFDDLDSMYVAAIGLHVSRVEGLWVLNAQPSSPLQRRIDQLVAQRARLYENSTSLRPVAEALRHRMPPVDALLRRGRDELRRGLRAQFAAELAALPPKERIDALEAAEAATSFRAWDQLRREQTLSVPRAQAVMARTVRGIFA